MFMSRLVSRNPILVRSWSAMGTAILAIVAMTSVCNGAVLGSGSLSYDPSNGNLEVSYPGAEGLLTSIAIGLGSDPTYPFVSTPTMQNSWSMGSYSENTLMLHDNDPDRAQSLQLGAVLPPGIPEQYFFYSMFHGTNNSGATYTTDFGFGGAFDFRLRYLAPGGPGYLVGDLGGIANNYFTMGLDSWEHYGDVSASQEYAVLTSSSEYDPVMDTFYDEFARIDQTVQVPQGATAIRLDASFSGYSGDITKSCG